MKSTIASLVLIAAGIVAGAYGYASYKDAVSTYDQDLLGNRHPDPKVLEKAQSNRNLTFATAGVLVVAGCGLLLVKASRGSKDLPAQEAAKEAGTA
ncbi:MAG TPA: hypothetical protein VLM40_00085 [Gemmata sp.]|nr:hypothetical protein [Gemmata sp.]